MNLTPEPDTFSVQGLLLWLFFWSAVLAAVATYDLIYVAAGIYGRWRRARRLRRLEAQAAQAARTRMATATDRNEVQK